MNRVPTTASEVFALVRDYGPETEGGELNFATDLPPELDVVLCVLHTGVRAVLTGRRWWDSSAEKVRVIELNPSLPSPAGIALLAVEGDDCWDRIRPDAHLDLPKLFAPDAVKARRIAGGNRIGGSPRWVCVLVGTC